MDYDSYLISNIYKYSTNPLSKEDYNTNFERISIIFNAINQHIELIKNHKNFEIMLIHYKKVIEYVEINKDSLRISSQIIQMHLQNASSLKNY
jgi:hypothetical protein